MEFQKIKLPSYYLLQNHGCHLTHSHQHQVLHPNTKPGVVCVRVDLKYLFTIRADVSPAATANVTKRSRTKTYMWWGHRPRVPPLEHIPVVI